MGKQKRKLLTSSFVRYIPFFCGGKIALFSSNKSMIGKKENDFAIIQVYLSTIYF